MKTNGLVVGIISASLLLGGCSTPSINSNLVLLSVPCWAPHWVMAWARATNTRTSLLCWGLLLAQWPVIRSVHNWMKKTDCLPERTCRIHWRVRRTGPRRSGIIRTLATAAAPPRLKPWSPRTARPAENSPRRLSLVVKPTRVTAPPVVRQTAAGRS